MKRPTAHTSFCAMTDAASRKLSSVLALGLATVVHTGAHDVAAAGDAVSTKRCTGRQVGTPFVRRGTGPRAAATSPTPHAAADPTTTATRPTRTMRPAARMISPDPLTPGAVAPPSSASGTCVGPG